MPIRFHCSHCHSPLAIGSRKAGTQVCCPACQGELTVPHATDVKPPASETIQANLPLPTSPVGAALRNPTGGLRSLLPSRLLVVAACLSLLFVGDLIASIFWINNGRTGPSSADLAEYASLFSSPDPTGQEEETPEPIVAASTKLPPAVLTAETPSSPADSLLPPEPFVGPPAPEPAAAQPTAVPAPVKIVVKRRQNLSDEDLRKQLIQVPELKLASSNLSGPFTMIQPRGTGKTGPEARTNLLPAALLHRPELTGLPMRMGNDCQLGKEPAENLQALSRKLREYVGASIPQGGTDPRPNPDVLRQKLLTASKDASRPRGSAVQPHEWLQPEAIPALTQILQAEKKPIRMLLVDLLAEIKGPEAGTALAQRALFDLSAEVREAAIQALSERPREEYRKLLLDGFRYPWMPVADHAAEALVALQDKEVVPQLVSLLKEPDPVGMAVGPSGATPVVRELVRINHFSNCTMCHAASTSQNDLVRGLVPVPGQALPPPTTPYYGGNHGPFVRADVTYLKQDFSVPQPVERPGVWPTMQRYDYVVRTRPVQKDLFASKPGKPQEALLFALGELDLGWKKLLEQPGSKPD